ncbi:MAG: hypothetical protein IPJ65_32620 [Archangiaceae bacterium]|nr:hypothetical protein [Archangiaceae bacterium]
MKTPPAMHSAQKADVGHRRRDPLPFGEIFLPLADDLQLGMQVLQQVVGLDDQVARFDDLATNVVEAFVGIGGH